MCNIGGTVAPGFSLVSIVWSVMLGRFPILTATRNDARPLKRPDLGTIDSSQRGQPFMSLHGGSFDKAAVSLKRGIRPKITLPGSPQIFKARPHE